jgi:hypothetical protein
MIRLVGCWEEPGEGSGQTCHYHVRRRWHLPTSGAVLSHRIGHRSSQISSRDSGSCSDPRHRPIPPRAEEIEALFAGWREELVSCRTFAPSARNYALARLAADVGLRINEARMLDLDDVRWELGRFGKLNVRHGKGSRRKGPKPRLVPLINGADRSLRWFIEPATPTDAPGTFRSTVPPRPTPRLTSPNRLNVRSGSVAGPPPERGATAVRRLIRYAGHDQAQR